MTNNIISILIPIPESELHLTGLHRNQFIPKDFKKGKFDVWQVLFL